jgi:ApbE superfamily uncharacterized protein (UPF0280 family)
MEVPATLSIDPKLPLRRLFAEWESRGAVVSDTVEAAEAGVTALKLHRAELKRYIRSNPVFQHSFEPIGAVDSPVIAARMADAAEKAGVGPMAAVAGALDDLAVEAMLEAGARVAVMENGGEVALASDRPIDIALQAGETTLSKRFGFRISRFPVGVATSSGVYSHAFSFGDAEAVTIFAGNAALADAAATAVCNIVSGSDVEAAVKSGVDRALSISEVEGVFVLYRGVTGTGGSLPEIIRVKPNGGAETG